MSSPQAKPEPAKQLLPFLQRADELQKHDLLVAYYCRLYAMELGLKIPVKERTKATNALLVSLMNQLEKDKKVVKLTPEDNLYMEGFALSVFSKADKQDRAGRADLNTAKTFYAASIFFDVLHQFSDFQPDIEQKAKYSVWKAADIRKALSEGRKPTAGPPGGDQEFTITGPDWEGEVSDVLGHPSKPGDQGPHTPDGHAALHSPSFPTQGSVIPDGPGATAPPFPAQGSVTPDSHGTPDLHSPSFPVQGVFTPDGHGATPLHPPYPVPGAAGSEHAYYFTHESSSYPPTGMQPTSYMDTSATPLPPSHNGIYYDGAGQHHQPISQPAAHSLYGSPQERIPDGTYQPTAEKIAESHKAAKYAVGALAFDDVPTAVSFLTRALQLLTSPSSTIH